MYYWIINESKTPDATSGTGTAYSLQHWISPPFDSGISCCSILRFFCSNLLNIIFGYCLFSPLNYDFWLPLLVSPNFSYLVSRSTPVRSILRHFLKQCIKYTLYEASSQQGHYLYLNIRNCVISKLMNINYLNMQDAFIMVYVINMEKNGLHQTGNVCKLSAA